MPSDINQEMTALVKARRVSINQPESGWDQIRSWCVRVAALPIYGSSRAHEAASNGSAFDARLKFTPAAGVTDNVRKHLSQHTG